MKTENYDRARDETDLYHLIHEVRSKRTSGVTEEDKIINSKQQEFLARYGHKFNFTQYKQQLRRQRQVQRKNQFSQTPQQSI